MLYYNIVWRAPLLSGSLTDPMTFSKSPFCVGPSNRISAGRVAVGARQGEDEEEGEEDERNPIGKSWAAGLQLSFSCTLSCQHTHTHTHTRTHTHTQGGNSKS